MLHLTWNIYDPPASPPPCYETRIRDFQPLPLYLHSIFLFWYPSLRFVRIFQTRAKRRDRKRSSRKVFCSVWTDRRFIFIEMRPPKLFIASFVYLSISTITLPLFVERERRSWISSVVSLGAGIVSWYSSWFCRNFLNFRAKRRGQGTRKAFSKRIFRSKWFDSVFIFIEEFFGEAHYERSRCLFFVKQKGRGTTLEQF